MVGITIKTNTVKIKHSNGVNSEIDFFIIVMICIFHKMPTCLYTYT